MRAINYCKRVFDGTHDTPKPQEKGKILVTSKHISGRKLDTSSAYLISEEDFNKINERSKIQRWDVLFSMIGTVGNVYIEENEDIDYAIKNIGVFSCEDENKALWLYYHLQSPQVKRTIDFFLSGAVQKFVPLNFLRNLEIPELTANRKCIAGVLANIDHKIALNREINRNLAA